MAMDLKEIEKYIKEAMPEAIIEIQECAATDWRKACFEWLDRRLNK